MEMTDHWPLCCPDRAREYEHWHKHIREEMIGSGKYKFDGYFDLLQRTDIAKVDLDNGHKEEDHKPSWRVFDWFKQYSWLLHHHHGAKCTCYGSTGTGAYRNPCKCNDRK